MTPATKTTQPQKPDATQVVPENIPVELKTMRQWVTWKYKWDGKRWERVEWPEGANKAVP